MRTRRTGILVAATLLLSLGVGSVPSQFAHAADVSSAASSQPTVLTSQGSLTYAKLSDGEFGLLDLQSGAFTQLNPSVNLVGLGELAGTLYGDTVGSGTLYKVDPHTGNLTSVGSAGISFQEFGSTTSGLFAIDYGMTLYSIDPATGAATSIGSTGLALPDHDGLSSGSSTLYQTQQFGSSTPVVYTLNTSTGAATPIGTTPGVFGPVVINGKLYVESWTPCTINPPGICAQSIYAFDPGTGISVFVSSVSTPLQEVSDGLAPVPTPAITAISPASGPLVGGTSVTITGTGFTGATAVDFGPTAAPAFTVNSDTSITATSPAATSVGPVDVTVTTPAGTSATSSADQFTYTYPFTGYQAPVDNPPTFNQVNGGQAIPMQFSLGSDFGLNIIASGYPTATQISCTTGAPVNTGTLTDTAGGSGLQFDSATGTYTYVWKTSKSWAGTCQQFDLRLNDGTDHTADFQFK